MQRRRLLPSHHTMAVHWLTCKWGPTGVFSCHGGVERHHLTRALAANDEGSATPASDACPRSLVPIRMTAALGAIAAAGVWPLRRRQSRCPVWSAAEAPHDVDCIFVIHFSVATALI